MIAAFDSVVVRTAVRILVPFIQLFALYVLFHGHESPGGGFQGGTILAASVILARLTQDPSLGLRYLPRESAIRLGAAGVLVYFGVGAVPLVMGRPFLDYSALPLPGVPAAELRALGILGVEIGVALAVTGVLVAIFDELVSGLGARSERG